MQNFGTFIGQKWFVQLQLNCTCSMSTQIVVCIHALLKTLHKKLNPMAEPVYSSSSVLFVATCVFSYFKAQVGTIRSKRTTVPLLYNLDGKVDGLDVIDFPGVDDKDQSIPQLANLLLGLVQAVIFVVDRG